MFKKAMLMAVAAAAFAAFLAPVAHAEPANWTMEGSPLEETGEITATSEPGNENKLGFKTANGGIRCHAHATADLTAGTDVGHLTQLLLTNCETTGALAVVCGAVKSVTVTALPTLTATTNTPNPGDASIDVSGLRVHNVLTGGALCPFPGGEVDVTGGVPTLTPDNAEEISTLTAGGKVTITGGAEAEAFGNLEVTKNAGTYGI